MKTLWINCELVFHTEHTVDMLEMYEKQEKSSIFWNNGAAKHWKNKKSHPERWNEKQKSKEFDVGE